LKITQIAIKTSDHIVRLGGTPMLRIISLVIMAAMRGIERGLLRRSRECVFSYNLLAQENMKGEQKPCDITIKSPQVYPNSVPLMKPRVTTPM